MDRIGSLNEAVMFVAKHTGWPLEYIRGLEVDVFAIVCEELSYQQRVTEYNQARPVVQFMAYWLSANTKGNKTYTAEELLGPPPHREPQEVKDIWKLAKDAGIRIPVNVA